MTYREANGRRLSHYLDDGLREAVDHTLPVLMKHCVESPLVQIPGMRIHFREGSLEFAQLVFAFGKLYQRLPSSTVKWLGESAAETNLVRLTFGMGVTARFAPDSHDFLLRMLEHPLSLSTPVLDVLESFRWHPEWSVALAA